MTLSKRIPFSILAFTLIFSGCISNVADVPDTAETGPQAGNEAATGLPPGDFIRFFDGKGMAAAPYVITDGMVMVDGDIVLGKASELLGREGGEGSPVRPLAKGAGNIMTTAMAGQANHWPSGRIPYVIETDAFRKSEILPAIKEWNAKAAVIWVPKTSQDVDYIAFVNHATLNNSLVGRMGGRQLINLYPAAGKRDAMHEMGHAAGLYHEHSRSDRAGNINLTNSFQYNHETNPNFGQVGTAVGAYDHQSLMHYNPDTYYFIWDAGCACWKITGSVTSNWVKMENQAGRPVILPGSTLSAGDVQTLRSLYTTALPYDQATSLSLTTGIGWPVVRPFRSGGLNFILHYNPADGQFRTYPFGASQGMINNPVEWGTWNSGWTSIEFYTIGSQTYALFYNGTTGSAYFYTMTATGKLGSWIESQNWNKNWDIARIYKPTVTEQRYMFLYNKGTGLAHIWGMKSNGALDLARNTYSKTLFGYEDFQVMEDVNCDWIYNKDVLPLKTTFLLYHDQQSSTQFLQVMDKNGGLGKWVTTSAVGTGFTQVGVYHRTNRSQAMYYNKSTGQLMICDVKPVFTGVVADPPLTSGNISVIRNHITSKNFQVYNFNISPWGNSVDPKGAERLFLFDPNLKRFWNSNLVPFPSI